MGRWEILIELALEFSSLFALSPACVSCWKTLFSAAPFECLQRRIGRFALQSGLWLFVVNVKIRCGPGSFGVSNLIETSLTATTLWLCVISGVTHTVSHILLALKSFCSWAHTPYCGILWLLLCYTASDCWLRYCWKYACILFPAEKRICRRYAKTRAL